MWLECVKGPGNWRINLTRGIGSLGWHARVTRIVHPAGERDARGKVLPVPEPFGEAADASDTWRRVQPGPFWHGSAQHVGAGVRWGKPQGGGLVPLGPCWGFPESRWGNPCVLPLAERCRRGTEAKSVGKGGMTKVSVVEEMATGTYSGACAVRCGRPQRCIASGRRRRRRRRGGRRWARGCPPCPSGLVRRGPHSPCR